MKAGDTVRLTRGPYSQYQGVVVSVKEEASGKRCTVRLENGFEVAVHERNLEPWEEVVIERL